MKVISEILFAVSNGLLVPVVLALLLLLLRALLVAVGLYGKYQRHRRIAETFRPVVKAYLRDRLIDGVESVSGLSEDIFIRCLTSILAHSADKAYCEYALSDYQVYVQKRLSKSRLLIKFGPMLGLMGTLIPMGPALVGLATGDIASMAYNMQVAFATTVVGMLIAGIGLISLRIDRTFYAAALNDLEFFYCKLAER